MGFLKKLFGNTGDLLPSSSQVYQQNTKQAEPYPEVLEVIRLYNELSDANCSIDKSERIRRCNEMLTEYEWHQSHKDNEAWYPNVSAIWQAVCDKDFRYEGNKYNQYSLMTDICLSIQAKY